MSEPQAPAPSRKPLMTAAVALVAVGGIGAAVYALRGKPQAPSTPPAATSPTPGATRPPSATEPDVSRVKPLPGVDESDTRTRELVGLLSTEPELQKWVATEGLIRRFTAAVSNIAEGESPRTVLAFMAPQGPFQVTQRDGHTFIAPESFARYDAVARVFTSLDPQITANTYKALKPVADAAFTEIARPGQGLDATLSRAIQRMLDTPVPQQDLEVVATQGINYTYAAPDLEQLSAAQKHLLRMGPANARALQAKLRELQASLGLPPAKP